LLSCVYVNEFLDKGVEIGEVIIIFVFREAEDQVRMISQSVFVFAKTI